MQDKRIKWIGFGMMLVADMILILSVFLSTTTSNKAYSETKVGVVCMYAAEKRFPEGDYRTVFSGMGIPSMYLHTDEESTQEELASEISSFLNDEGLERVVLMTYGNTIYHGIDLFAANDLVAGLMVVMPEFDAARIIDSASLKRLPRPVGIFGINESQTNRLYELLSGEDTTMTRSLSGYGFLSPEVRISPDALTYLSVRTILGSGELDPRIASAFPDTYMKISVFLDRFILQGEEPLDDPRGVIFSYQALKLIPLVLLICGWFLFLSSVSSERLPRIKVIEEKERKKPSEIAIYAKIERSERYIFALLLPVAVVWSVLLGIVVIVKEAWVSYFVVSWVIFSTLSAAFFYLKHIRKLGLIRQVFDSKFLISVAVTLSFLLGVFVYVIHHVSSLNRFVVMPRMLVLILLSILLIVGLIACQKIDFYYSVGDKNPNHGRGFLSSMRFRFVSVLPMIIALVFAFLSKQAWMFVVLIAHIVLVIFSDYFRRKVRHLSGSSLLPAASGALLYMILSML